MRLQVSFHPPSRGESVEWRLVRCYRDGVRRVGSSVFSTYDGAQDAAECALDEPGVGGVDIEGRPRGGDWRRDARYELEHSDYVELARSVHSFEVVSLPIVESTVEGSELEQ